MVHQLRRDARRRRGRATAARMAAVSGLVALMLLALFGARIDLLGQQVRDSLGATSEPVGMLRWALGSASSGVPHVLVPDVRSGAEQLGRLTSGPEPWSTAGAVGVLVGAMAWTVLPAARRSMPRRASTGPVRRRGPPAPAATTSLLRRA